MLAVEQVDILNARGRVLAEDIFSDIDLPPFDKSSMDGYALRHEDTVACPLELDVIGTIPAGIVPEFVLKTGQAAKIMTGAPIPGGADSVQMIEKTEQAGGGVIILEPVSLGKHVAKKSEVMTADSKVMSHGDFISSVSIGVLATVGRPKVEVVRKPAVGILITGDELVDVQSKPAAGQIRNSNGYCLYHQVLSAGGTPHLLGIAADDADTLSARISEGLSYDVLLISGGVSMGDYDFVSDVLSKHGVEILFKKMNIKPGKPTVFGTKNNCLIFGLPGNPVSASTVFEVLVRPCLRKMQGHKRPDNMFLKCTLDSSFELKSTRHVYHPARTFVRGRQLFVTPLASKGSADILAFSRSNAFLVAEDAPKVYEAGSPVVILPRSEFWKC